MKISQKKRSLLAFGLGFSLLSAGYFSLKNSRQQTFIKANVTQNLLIERTSFTRMNGETWRDNEIRSVVDYSPASTDERPDIWKEFVMIHVFLQRTSPNIEKLPVWRGDEVRITDQKGHILQGAVVATGPMELDGKGNFISSEEKTPAAYVRHYELRFELNLAESYQIKNDLTLESQISDNTGLTIPISVTIPRNFHSE